MEPAVRANAEQTLNAFSVDLEEWWHVCGVDTPYSTPATWDLAPASVVKNTEVLMRLLDEARTRATFLAVGWVADKYPSLIKRLVDAGHELGCHSYFHRVVFDQTPDEFEADLRQCLETLRGISGQAVRVFRAPGFSITRECFWAYPILSRYDIEIDVSIVPAARDHGGVRGFTRDPFLLRLPRDTTKPALADPTIRCFPVSVMDVLGRRVQFSGGGYMRVLPLSLIEYGYRQNHAAGRPGMSYIHPREVDLDQPRLPLPWKKYAKYYMGLHTVREKLGHCLRTFKFATVSEVVASVKHWPEYQYVDGDIRPASPASKTAPE